jgi:hypothetical protein
MRSKKYKNKNKRTNKKRYNKYNKTRKNLGRGPKMAIRLPPLSMPDSSRFTIMENPISKFRLTPLIIKDNPISTFKNNQTPILSIIPEITDTNIYTNTDTNTNTDLNTNLITLEYENETPSIVSEQVLDQLSEQVLDQILSNDLNNSNKNNKTKKKKQVKINTPENELKEYELGSSEKNWKKTKKIISEIKKCKKERTRFPCKIKRTVFTNRDDYQEYLNLKMDKNSSINDRTKSEHYDFINNLLRSQGKYLRRNYKKRF